MIRAAVLGKPISHSLSPSLHRAAYKKLGIDGLYESYEVGEGELAKFIATHNEGWTGFSLTMPLKEVCLEVATSIDPTALRIKSANTLLKRGRNWYATSTDRTGFLSLFASHKFLGAQKVLLLGAGGTARAAIAALDQAGREIVVCRRNPLRDQAIQQSAIHARLSTIEWLQSDLAEFDLVINTVPGDASSVMLERLDGAPALVDVLYHPWPSALAARWMQHNSHIVSGIELLIWQGIDQIELMTGESFDREDMFNYLFHSLVRLQ